MKDNIILGVDIGGSHITAALVDVESGRILDSSSFREKIESQGEASGIIRSWCGVIRRSLRSGAHSGKIAVAMPGPFDYANGISHMKGMGKYEALYGLDVRSLIFAELGEQVELRFVNDAECFLQGELSHGIASDYQNVVGFTIGTGFGSSRGKWGIASDADLWNRPFMGGICEDFFSSRWFVSRYTDFSGLRVPNVKEIIENIDLASPLLQLFDEFSMNLGTFLAKLHKEDHFDCVVLGGNISNASELFIPQLRYHLQTMSVEVPVYISDKGEDAALIGAACSF